MRLEHRWPERVVFAHFVPAYEDADLPQHLYASGTELSDVPVGRHAASSDALPDHFGTTFNGISMRA